MPRDRIPPKNVDLVFLSPTNNTKGLENRSNSLTADFILFVFMISAVSLTIVLLINLRFHGFFS